MTRWRKDLDNFRITQILDLSTTASASTPSSASRSLSESDKTDKNMRILSTSPSIRVTPPTPHFGRFPDDSFGSAGSLPRPESRSHVDAWKQLNDDLNMIFPKRCFAHERRTSLMLRRPMDDDDHDHDVYHTVHGGKNNPLTGSRAVGPFSKFVRHRMSTSPSDGILENSSTSSSMTSLTSISNLTPSIDPRLFFCFAPVAVRSVLSRESCLGDWDEQIK